MTKTPKPIFKSLPVSSIILRPQVRSKVPSGQSLEQLAESIRQNGVIQPITVRPVVRTSDDEPEQYELVAGERRYRASILADQVKISCCIREGLTDDEAVDLQLTENLQREDLTPMEEAIFFKQLMLTKAYLPTELSLRLSKGLDYVERRLRLNTLLPEAQALVASGVLSLMVADLIAVLLPSDQTKLLRYCILSSYGPGDKEKGAPLSQYCRPLSEVRWFLQNSILMRLDEAPFSKNSKIPGLSSSHVVSPTCVLCPQRTGANATLFNDIIDGDRCQNRKCFGLKFEAHFQNILDEHRRQHGTEAVFVKETNALVAAPKAAWSMHEVRVLKPGEAACSDTKPAYLLYKDQAPKLAQVCLGTRNGCMHRQDIGYVAQQAQRPAAAYAYTRDLLRRATRNLVINQANKTYRTLVRQRIAESQPLSGPHNGLLVLAQMMAGRLGDQEVLEAAQSVGYTLFNINGGEYRAGEAEASDFQGLVKLHLSTMHYDQLSALTWALFVAVGTASGTYLTDLKQNVITPAIDADLRATAERLGAQHVDEVLALPELQPDANGVITLTWEQVTKYDIDTPDQLEDDVEADGATSAPVAELA